MSIKTYTKAFQTLLFTLIGATLIAQSSLSFTPTTLQVPATGGQYTVTVNATAGMQWTMSYSAVPGVTIAPSSGSGTAQVVITVPANISSASITHAILVTGAGFTMYYNVYQAAGNTGTTFTVSPSTISIPAAGGQAAVSVTTASNWTATTTTAWLTITPSSGSGSSTASTVTIAATANPTTANRTGSVTFNSAGLTRTVSVTQQGTCIDPSEPNDVFSSATSLGAVATSTSHNGSCLSAGDQDWFSFSVGGTSFYAKVRGFSASVVGPYDLNINTTATGFTIATARIANTTTNTDTYLELYDATGATLLAGNDDGAGNMFSSITWNLNGQNPTPNAFINATPVSFSATNTGGTFTSNVTSNVSWNVNNANTWFTVTRQNNTNNDALTIVVSANPNSSNRSGTFTLTSTQTNIVRTMSVNQAATIAPCNDPSEPNGSPQLATYLGVVTATTTITTPCLDLGDEDLYSFSTASGIYFVKIRGFSATNTRGAYSLSITFTAPNIITVATDAVNGSTTDTYAHLYDASMVQLAQDDDSGPGMFSLINYNPNAPVLTVSPSYFSATLAGGNFTSNITSNNPWTAVSNVAWISINNTSGAGNGALTFFVNANGGNTNRTGTITVTAGGVSRTISVNQAAPANTLTVTPSYLSFLAAGSTLTSTVTASGAWTITNVPAWITVSPMSGTGNGTLTVTTSANAAPAQRNGSFRVVSGSSMRTVSCVQAANIPPCVDPFEPNNSLASPTSVNMPFSNNQLCLTAGDHDYFAFSFNNANYFLQVRGFGTNTAGAYGLEIMASNTGFTARTFQVAGTTDTYLTLYNAQGVAIMNNDDFGGTLFSQISFLTNPQTLTVSPNQIQVPAAGGTRTVSVISNGTWSVNNLPTWITCTPSSGTGNTAVVFTIASNAGSAPQTGYVLFSGAAGSNLNAMLTVNQGINVPAPSNDEPCNATILNVSTTCTPSSSTNLGATGTTTPIAPTSCPYFASDVWFRFVVPASGSFTITTSSMGLNDPVMAVYNGDTLCNVDSFAFQCVDDYNGLLPRIVANNQTPGATIYVRVWGYGTQMGGFGICVMDGYFPLIGSEPNVLNTPVAIDGEMVLYPNPSSGDVTISYVNTAEATQGDVQVMDISGRMLHSTQMSLTEGANSLPMSLDLANGMYQVRLTVGDKVMVKKLVIAK